MKKLAGSHQWMLAVSLGLAVTLGAIPNGQAESLSGDGPSWCSSIKKFGVGDLVTVIVSESAQMEQSASTQLSKDSKVGFTSGGLLANLAPAASAGLNTDHDGKGNLTRLGRMQARVTVKVEEVLTNGCLRIKGNQMIVTDSGEQRISVAGVIRPRDVSPENDVYSYKIADAAIEYSGEGALHEKARTGFLARFLEWIWIF